MTKPKPKPKKTTKPAKTPASPVVEPRKPGRPKGSGIIHEPTKEKKDELVNRIAEGEPLLWIRRSGWDPEGPNAGQPMPGTTLLWEWEEEDPEFSERIARAREAGQTNILEGTFFIADDSSDDFRMGAKSGLVKTDAVDRAKLRIWQRLQLADRLNPKTHAPGKRLMDGEGNPVMPTEIQIVGVAAKKAVDAMAGVSGVKPVRKTSASRADKSRT